MSRQEEWLRLRMQNRKELLDRAEQYEAQGMRGLALAYRRAAKCERKHINRITDHVEALHA